MREGLEHVRGEALEADGVLEAELGVQREAARLVALVARRRRAVEQEAHVGPRRGGRPRPRAAASPRPSGGRCARPTRRPARRRPGSSVGLVRSGRCRPRSTRCGGAPRRRRPAAPSAGCSRSRARSRRRACTRAPSTRRAKASFSTFPNRLPFGRGLREVALAQVDAVLGEEEARAVLALADDGDHRADPAHRRVRDVDLRQRLGEGEEPVVDPLRAPEELGEP